MRTTSHGMSPPPSSLAFLAATSSGNQSGAVTLTVTYRAPPEHTTVWEYMYAGNINTPREWYTLMKSGIIFALTSQRCSGYSVCLGCLLFYIHTLYSYEHRFTGTKPCIKLVESSIELITKNSFNQLNQLPLTTFILWLPKDLSMVPF